MECKNCKKQINDEYAVCPYCGTSTADTPVQQTNYQPQPVQPKKNNKKKIGIIIAVVAVVLILFIALMSGDDDSEQTSGNNTQTNTSTTADSQTTTEVITNAYMQMKPSEIYKNIGESEDLGLNYSISERAISFIDENADLFPCSEDNFAKLSPMVTEVDYREITKSPQNFDNKIIRLSSVYVIDISEESDEKGGVTYIHVSDYDGNSYVGYYLSTLPGIYQDSIVDLYGVPINVVYFDNISNEVTVAVMLAVCYCEDSLSAANMAAANTTSASPEFEMHVDKVYDMLTSPEEYFLSLDPQAPYFCQVTTQTGSPLNLRSGNGTDYDIITQIENGFTVQMYGTYDGWAYISTYDGYSGWVAEQYLT